MKKTSVFATLLWVATSVVAQVLPSCEWVPAQDRYQGRTVDAIDSYGFDQATSAALKKKMENHDADDVVVITRQSVVSERGLASYSPTIGDMHFGARGLCRKVTRKKWSDEHFERGFVYCHESTCVVVPFVCANVARIDRRSHSPGQGVERTGSLPPIQFAPMGEEALPVGDVAFPQGALPLPHIASTPAPIGGIEDEEESFSSRTGRDVVPVMSFAVAPPSAIFRDREKPPPIPEPPMWLLLLLGVAAIALRRRV